MPGNTDTSRKVSVSRPITRQGSTRERSSSTEGHERQQGRRGNKEKDSYRCGSCGLVMMDDDAALECDLCKFGSTAHAKTCQPSCITH